MDVITFTFAITLFHVLNYQECHCDGVCEIGAAGEIGVYQVTAFGIMERLGCPKDEVDWWSVEDAMPCIDRFMVWLSDTQYCDVDVLEWSLASYNWGIGNVRALQKEHGCDILKLPNRVYRFAKLERGLMCYEQNHGFLPTVGLSHEQLPEIDYGRRGRFHPR